MRVFFVGTVQMAAVFQVGFVPSDYSSSQSSLHLRRNPTTVKRVSVARTAQGVIPESGYRSLHQNKNCCTVYINSTDYIDQPTAAVKEALEDTFLLSGKSSPSA